MTDNRQKHEKGEPPDTYTPWLVIRATPSDRGARSLPSGTVYWASPDIMFAPTNPLGQVTAGDDVTVSVTVQNLGRAPAPNVQARFWWVNPSVGVSPASATLIGTSDKLSIAAGLAETLTCTTSWRPTFVNGGHECLFVEAGGLGDRVQSPFRADLDRHVGQRNVMVLDETFGLPYSMKLIAANPFPEGSVAQIRVRTTMVFGPGPLLEGQTHLLTPIDLLTHIADPTLRDAVARAGVEIKVTDDHLGLQVDRGDTSSKGGGGFDKAALAGLRERLNKDADLGQTIETIELGANGSAEVLVSIGQAAASNTAVVHHIAQVTDGIDTGGYTVLLV